MPSAPSATRSGSSIASRIVRAYDCDSCGYHLHPTAGTIFHKSATSLHLWFYAMYVMASTRCGISAKQLERELGVTYKTAWRMFNKIRNEVMDESDDSPLSGEVEADETLIGGKMRNRIGASGSDAAGTASGTYNERKKTMVFGAVERGGRVRATVIPNSRAKTLHAAPCRFVMPESILFHRRMGRRTRGSGNRRAKAPSHPPRRGACTSRATSTRRPLRASGR